MASNSKTKALATLGLGAQMCMPVIDAASGGALTGGAVLASVLGAAASFSQDVCSKMAADKTEVWLRGQGGDEMLANHHLSEALGDAIAAITRAEADACDSGPQKKALTDFAGSVSEAWQQLGTPPLGDGEVADMFARRADAPDAPVLTVEAWRALVDNLADRSLDSRTRNRISRPARQTLAEQLHTGLPFALREALKKDAEEGGRAYAGLVLLLLGETLSAVRSTPPGEDGSSEGTEEMAERVASAIAGLREPLIAELEELEAGSAARHEEAIARLDDLLGAVREEGTKGRHTTRKEAEKTRAEVQNVGAGVQRVEEKVDRLFAREQAAALPEGRSQMPARPTRLVGRGEEIETVLSALADHSLVTLSGTGGIGKSTLARALAWRVESGDAEAPWAEAGVDYVDLSSQESAQAVLDTITSELHLDPPPESTGELVRRLSPRGPRLYIFDDVQQAIVADEAATLDFIRALGTYDVGFRMLLTCRREPPAGHDLELGALSPEPARALFRSVVEDENDGSARIGSAAYTWQDGDEAALDRLLPELDGHPLVIELAAGLLGLVPSVEALYRRWTERRTALLETLGGSRSRRESMTVSLDLSYAALGTYRDPELARALFALMADVPAGATPELVEALFGFEGLHAIEALRRRRLVYREGRRYQMLIPVRHFAAKHSTPMADEKRSELDDFLLALAQDADERWTRDDGTAVRLMERERPNIDAALESATVRGDDAYVAKLSRAAKRVFQWQFGQASSRHWLEEGRQAADRIGDAEWWAELTFSLGKVARLQDDYAAARTAFETARNTSDKIGYRLGAANATLGLGEVAFQQDDYAAARTAFETARNTYEEIGERRGVANATKGLGQVARLQDDYAAARTAFEAARKTYEEIGDRYSEAWAHYRLGSSYAGLDQVGDARHAWQSALRLFETIENTRGAQAARDALSRLDGSE